MIIVADPVASRRALAGRQLCCPKPGCAGRLRLWTAVRARTVQGPGGIRLQVHPDRGLCTACRSSQVLLPAMCLPRWAYTADVVGAVLLDVERGLRVPGAAAAHQVPVSTARRWVAAVTSAGSALKAAALEIAGAFGDTTGCWPPLRPSHRDGPLTGVLHALGGAVAAWTASRAAPSRGAGRAGALSGIDYLAQLSADYHRQLLRERGVADPGEALGVSVTGWPLVNVVTGGRLLSPAPASPG